HQDDFLQVLETSVGLALALLQMMAGRLYETDRRLSRYAPDPVTGLASRRAFLDQYRRLAAVARRRGTGALMLVLDVVHLRAINDRFGYGVGDDVLRAVADALIEATRTTDLVARHGSDEFAIFFPDAGRGAVRLGAAPRRAPPDRRHDLLRRRETRARRARDVRRERGDGRLERRRRDDAIHEPHAERFARVDRPAGQQELARPAAGQDVEQPRDAVGGVEAQRDLGEAEARPVGGHAEVLRRREHEAA